MPREAVLAKVGQVAVAWNEAERIISHLLYLYLDTDVQTAEILTKPMRPSDREGLLRKLVHAKEIDAQVREEIDEALKLCSICRDNRNTVLHHGHIADGVQLEKALAAVGRLCMEFDNALAYLRALQNAVTEFVYGRLGRETPIGDESSDDELLPEITFSKPDRPKRPRRFNPQEIFPHAQPT